MEPALLYCQLTNSPNSPNNQLRVVVAEFWGERDDLTDLIQTSPLFSLHYECSTVLKFEYFLARYLQYETKYSTGIWSNTTTGTRANPKWKKFG